MLGTAASLLLTALLASRLPPTALPTDAHTH